MSENIDDKMDTMRPGRGRYVVNAKGEVAPEGALALPDGVTSAPALPSGILVAPPGPMGPTRVGEWLMVDIRVAKSVPAGTRLYKICQDLGERGFCGLVESTLVIDILEASAEDRPFLLNRLNWPAPK